MPLLEAKSVLAFVAGGAVALGAWTMGVASVSGPSAAAPPLAPAVAASPVVASPASASPAVVPAATTPKLVRRACADKRTGTLFVIGAGTNKKRCSRGQVRVAWPVPPPPTPSLLAPDGSLRITSPNKQYLLVINDEGVGIRGPGGAILIDRASVKQFDSAGRAPR
jgi:hypothetical protein